MIIICFRWSLAVAESSTDRFVLSMVIQYTGIVSLVNVCYLDGKRCIERVYWISLLFNCNDMRIMVVEWGCQSCWFCMCICKVLLLYCDQQTDWLPLQLNTWLHWTPISVHIAPYCVPFQIEFYFKSMISIEI